MPPGLEKGLAQQGLFSEGDSRNLYNPWLAE